ncbi:LysM peptidoglycan-binding domain-containing protein [Flavobacterium endoglycinae]|uniref:LysM peptidoglycan-binding domain-containing protein n=2 Tax=Flavobacterium endoglycinae TaxID=2816357 RepID=A0ABX7QAJ4_9FLAO|nr:LysM peptidoglycan-binding domain-containing protein [Flavobacterium endoglycinae]
MDKLIIFFCCLFFSTNDNQQKTESLSIPKKMISKIDITEGETYTGNHIYNSKVLESVFKKLIQNESEKNQKINIVHIGDSHIQGDLMTNKIRKILQQQFGNGGRGFVFPYQLAKTNGSYNERFRCNRIWDSYRNIYPVRNYPVGLSGIGLWRDTGGFVVEMSIKDPSYKFNTIQIITPKNESMFDLSSSSQTKFIETTERKIVTHKIKKGEAISIIADKYNVSVADIKKANQLKSNNIRAGRILRIPTNEMQPKNIKTSEFVPLNLESDAFCHFYKSEKALDKIYLVPHKEAKDYELNGLVLEKDAPGLIYSGIGVNGAKYSDYNKYPLFFEQLKALHPDLLIFSLGTNESFDKLETSDYIQRLRQFIKNIKDQNINVPIIVMTPPPSLFRGGKPNNFVGEYAQRINDIAEKDGFAVWDLYDEFGGLKGIRQLKSQGLIGKDWVHYSKKGYEKQGSLFTEAFLKAYDNFKSNK